MKNIRKIVHAFPIIIIFLTVISVTRTYAYESIVTHLSQQAFKEKIGGKSANVAIIDIRTPREFSQGRVPGAINIPHDQILQNISLLDKYSDKEIVFYCHSGVRVERVTDYLGNINYSKVYHLKGDYRAWRANSQAIEK